MKIRLRPDKALRSEKMRISSVPVLVLRPTEVPPIRVGVLWIHGGGYFTGMKEMVYMGRGADFAKHFGAAVFSPGYRLAWLHPYPAALEDCFSVLQYMHVHRTELGIDRIMVGGESAGGGLCAAVCMMARDQGIPVAFQMPLYPMLSCVDTQSSRDNHGRIWNTRRNHFGWQLYLRREKGKTVSPYASPAMQTSFCDLPPCYTFVGDGEPFYDETMQYVDRLRAAGVEAEADVYHTDYHAFDLLRPDDPLSREAIGKLHRRFEQALKRQE